MEIIDRCVVRKIDDSGFLDWRWRVPIDDPIRNYFDGELEIITKAHKQAEWRKNLAAAR